MLPQDAGTLSLSTTPFATFAECPRKYRLVHEMGLEIPIWEGARRSFKAPSMEEMRAAGTAAHHVLEHFALDRWGEPLDRAEIERLLAREMPIGDPAIRVAVGANVARFLGSRYAARVRQSGASVYREEPFVLELGAGREKLLLRGIIDLLVAFPDRSADVIDYKSSGRTDDPAKTGGGARDFQLRAYGLAARRKWDLAPVRVGIVDLSSVSEPSIPSLLDDAELIRFEGRLLQLRNAFVAARAGADFPGLAREQCVVLRCGFVRACHG